jgi:predicted nucleic acid-binding protein
VGEVQSFKYVYGQVLRYIQKLEHLTFPSVINLDTNTAIAFIAQESPIRQHLNAIVQDQQLIMAQTAFDEFCTIVRYSAGVLEQARAKQFLQRVTIVPDRLSPKAQALKPTRSLDPNDIIILGTGDHMGIVTLTADAKAVRAASAQGVDFNVYLHSSYPLTGC